jgi:hypothetical protein
MPEQSIDSIAHLGTRWQIAALPIEAAQGTSWTLGEAGT